MHVPFHERPLVARHPAWLGAWLAVGLLFGLGAHAQTPPPHEDATPHRAAQSDEPLLDERGDDDRPLAAQVLDAAKRLPSGVQRLTDIRYGANAANRFDVYRPANADLAPIILMVHGGGWRTGSKASSAVVSNKVAHWVTQGVIVVSADYRLLPDADPLEQAQDIAQALAHVQAHASRWGGDPKRVVLMGHSAGAHLVALLHARPMLAYGVGAKPWLSTIALDSAALDVPAIMEAPHPRLYDRAFGRDPGFWQAASPWHQMTKGMPPMLAVCSTLRDTPCPQARRFKEQARKFGGVVDVLPVALSHRDINAALGHNDGAQAAAYTQQVDRHLRRIDPQWPISTAVRRHDNARQ